jgi:hypothetical protein
MFTPPIPAKVRRKLRELGCVDTKWELYDDNKWFGYTVFAERRVAITCTLALVTGKAVVEILAPIVNEDILI